jgi:hypothetical protein
MRAGTVGLRAACVLPSRLVALVLGLTAVGLPAPAWAVTPAAADTEAVAMVKARGGSVELDAAGHVVAVDLAERPATDADLEQLAGLEGLTKLEVWGAEISDRGLAAIARMKNLEQLVLENTDVTDAGAAKLVALENLRVLNLRR